MNIIILVGPKGSGKTTLGKWIAQDSEGGGIILEVEMIAKQIMANAAKAGESTSWTKEHTQILYDEIFNEIESIASGTRTSALQKDSSIRPNCLVYETTGAAQPETQQLLDRLKGAKHACVAHDPSPFFPSYMWTTD